MAASPFDHDRHDWYPAWPEYPTCNANRVCTSSGTSRPALTVPLNLFIVHYGGAGTNWTDPGDTATELRNVEVNHARPNNKPNEYNSAGDAQGETWEYAGPFRAAHASGYNTIGWGHLCLYGLENLTEQEAQGLILSVRKARAQCVAAGYLTPGHQVKGHMDVGQTGCPGPLRTNVRWWSQITAPLTPDPPPPTTEDTTVIIGKHRDPDNGTITYHAGNGLARWYVADGAGYIAGMVRCGIPLKDWGTGNDVKTTGDVTITNVNAFGLDPSKWGPKTFTAN